LYNPPVSINAKQERFRERKFTGNNSKQKSPYFHYFFTGILDERKIDVEIDRMNKPIHGKNDFAEGSKILLDRDLKIILLDHQNNFFGNLKIMSNAAKNFDILATSSSFT